MAEIVTPRPASTILLLRESAARREEVEVFMMVRHYEIDFNSGALVFPGGSVDENDREIIARPELYSGGEGLDADALSFRVAAIRETFEESGILLARPKRSSALLDAARASQIEAAHRAALCEGKTTFLNVLADNGLWLALDELTPYAHWITPEGMPKRFDTWFFWPPLRPTSSARMTAGSPPTRFGCRRARRWRAARAAASSCRFRPRAT